MFSSMLGSVFVSAVVVTATSATGWYFRDYCYYRTTFCEIANMCSPLMTVGDCRNMNKVVLS
jgi:hypothetical protein